MTIIEELLDALEIFSVAIAAAVAMSYLSPGCFATMTRAEQVVDILMTLALAIVIAFAIRYLST